MNIKATAEISKASMRKFQKKFGDTSNQALLRLAVSTGRECALLTHPMKNGKAVQMDAIQKGARKNIAVLPPKLFNQITKKPNPAFRFSRGAAGVVWSKLTEDRILRSDREIYDFIEQTRKPNGRAGWLPYTEKAICKKGDFNKAMVRRRKLAGVTKGSWLGGHQELSKKIRGGDKPRLGKNFMNYAQKHMDKGTGKYRGKKLGKSEAHLISEAPATKDQRIFPKKNAKDAVERAWKKTYRWYRLQCRLQFAK